MRLVLMEVDDIEHYEEEEVVYINGGLPRDEDGYFYDQMYNEYQRAKPPMDRSKDDL